jgi:hypothetical protein
MADVEHQFVTRCLRCGWTLSAASSVAAGYGRCCARLVRLAAVTAELVGFAQTAREKAVELIAAGGVVPTGFPGVFRTVSSSGHASYLTHSAACNCPAGLHGLLCYHVAAVRFVTGSQARSAFRPGDTAPSTCLFPGRPLRPTVHDGI